MGSRTIKVHFIPEPRERYQSIRTACGKEGMQCQGYDPRPGSPGEYDDTVCNRFEATTFPRDVTCSRCGRAARKATA